jgi:hypothetical protein
MRPTVSFINLLSQPHIKGYYERIKIQFFIPEQRWARDAA